MAQVDRWKRMIVLSNTTRTIRENHIAGSAWTLTLRWQRSDSCPLSAKKFAKPHCRRWHRIWQGTWQTMPGSGEPEAPNRSRVASVGRAAPFGARPPLRAAPSGMLWRAAGLQATKEIRDACPGRRSMPMSNAAKQKGGLSAMIRRRDHAIA